MTTTSREPGSVSRWPGGTYDPASGSVALGPFLERSGLARWRVYSQRRMWGGLLVGDAAGGKTVTLESLGLSLVATGVTTIWFVNAQIGAPRPLLEAHAESVADSAPAIRDLFAEAIRIKRERQVAHARAGRDGFEPTEGQPGLMILVDACELVFADAQVQAMAIELAREGGPVGIAMVAASQRLTRDAFGPSERARDAEVLRGKLAAGNLLLFRMSGRYAQQMLGLDVDLAQLPRGCGRAYLLDRTGAGRSGPVQVFIAGDEASDQVAVQDPTYRPLPADLAARMAALPRTWLGDDPTTRLGAALHTEVGHDGRCYTVRAGRAAIAAVPLGLGASAAYTVGQQIHHHGLATALAHWPALSPTVTLAAVLAALVLCVGATLGWHAAWHRDEAPFAGNEVLGLAPEPSDG